MKNPDAFKAFYRDGGKKKQEASRPAGPRPARPAPPAGGRRPGKGPAPKPTPASGYAPLKGPGEEEGFPLNKYIAHCGICSRRKAVEYVKAGRVRVNGQVVTEPGFKIRARDHVELNGQHLRLKAEPVYLLLNKPKDYLTTTKDPQGRRTVMEIIRHATTERVYPVGRLDRNTSGLLLFTNDGELAQKLSHPGCQIKKVYHVTLDKPLAQADFERILAGLVLEDGVVPVDALAYADEKDRSQLGIEIHIGRNRIVRRLFEHLGYEVRHLDRVLYAGLTKKNLPRGQWRLLSEKEVRLLKHFTPGRPR